MTRSQQITPAMLKGATARAGRCTGALPMSQLATDEGRRAASSLSLPTHPGSVPASWEATLWEPPMPQSRVSLLLPDERKTDAAGIAMGRRTSSRVFQLGTGTRSFPPKQGISRAQFADPGKMEVTRREKWRGAQKGARGEAAGLATELGALPGRHGRGVLN